MSREIPDIRKHGRVGFRKITESFLTCKGLPFDKVLSEEKIVDIFSKHNNLFAANGIYSTAVVLWAFLGQALRDGKEASCQFAVSCIIDFCLLYNRAAPTQDTGVYCVAREKLSERALRGRKKVSTTVLVVHAALGDPVGGCLIQVRKARWRMRSMARCRKARLGSRFSSTLLVPSPSTLH